jgi:hypothetical protein
MPDDDYKHTHRWHLDEPIRVFRVAPGESIHVRTPAQVTAEQVAAYKRAQRREGRWYMRFYRWLTRR